MNRSTFVAFSVLLSLLAVPSAQADCPIEPVAFAAQDGRLQVLMDSIETTDQPLLFLQPVQVGTGIKFTHRA